MDIAQYQHTILVKVNPNNKEEGNADKIVCKAELFKFTSFSSKFKIAVRL